MNPNHSEAAGPETGLRRQRLARAEALLDRWLDLFESALNDARPDPTKTTELANIFTICRRILEIEALMRKLDAQDPSDDTSPSTQYPIYPVLHGDSVPESSPED